MSARTLEALAVTLALMAPVAAHAGWRDVASSYDQGRLARLDQARSEGMADSGGMPGVQETMSAAVVSPGGLSGHYRCRTIKLGGMTPYVVYGWFNCRIGMRGRGLFFQKTSGSQRTAGSKAPCRSSCSCSGHSRCKT